jgi:hypothetical protein
MLASLMIGHRFFDLGLLRGAECLRRFLVARCIVLAARAVTDRGRPVMADTSGRELVIVLDGRDLRKGRQARLTAKMLDLERGRRSREVKMLVPIFGRIGKI